MPRLAQTLCFSALISLGALGLFAAEAAAQEPGWSGRVVTFGEQRAAIESTPIIQRQYRPLHFYGNTIRRMYYRGTAMPSPRDVGAGLRSMIGR